MNPTGITDYRTTKLPKIWGQSPVACILFRRYHLPTEARIILCNIFDTLLEMEERLLLSSRGDRIMQCDSRVRFNPVEELYQCRQEIPHIVG